MPNALPSIFTKNKTIAKAVLFKKYVIIDQKC